MLDFNNNCSWMFDPQKYLYEDLFDSDMIVYEKHRQSLLKYAQFYIDECLNIFPWFKLKDIILGGDLASYYYHDKSNIEVRIVVEIVENNPFVSDEHAIKLLSKQFVLFCKNKPNFRLLEKWVQFAIIYKMRDISYYSLLNNKWIVKPTKERDNLAKDEIIKKVENQIKIMVETAKNKFDKINGKYKLDDLAEVQNLSSEIIKNKFSSMEGQIIEKILRNSGIITQLNKFSKNELTKALSF